MAIVPALTGIGRDLKADIELLMVVEPVPPSGELISPSAIELDGPSGPGPALVFEKPSDGVWMESQSQAIDRADSDARSALDNAARPLKDAGFKVREKVLVENNAADAIIDYARRKHFDLIAMSTHGRSGLRRVIHGSVAGAVAGSGVAPVLLVRPVE